MTKYLEILRYHSLGLSQDAIAKSLAVSKKTVNCFLQYAKTACLNWPLDESFSETRLARELAVFLGKEPKVKGYIPRSQKRMPDFCCIRKELAKNGVSKKLLWMEYIAECNAIHAEAFMYSQFCWLIQQDEQKHRATMHINRKPGEQFEVDWAGDTAKIIDIGTGEILKAYVFVGVSTYSLYTYAEAFLDMKEQAWITAHNHMYQYFGGVSKILVPDNCKTAVLHTNGWHEQQLNQTYKELANHYNTVIIPARIRTPKDKASVEGTVGNISSQIIASLRNEKFFNLTELNSAIKTRLKIFNTQPFQKREGSRSEIFRTEELPLLAALPATPYELSVWKQATVQYNYHVACEGMMYSVPFEYIHRKVNVQLTDKVVKIFYNDDIIATHPRIRGHKGQYSTAEEHMPKEHREYLKWDGNYFRSRAKELGPNIYKVIDAILLSGKIEQQHYRSCVGLLNLTKKKYSVEHLEKACAIAMSYTSSPSYKLVKNLMQSVNIQNVATDKNSAATKPNGITRGAAHYGGGASHE